MEKKFEKQDWYLEHDLYLNLRIVFDEYDNKTMVVYETNVSCGGYNTIAYEGIPTLEQILEDFVN